MKENGNTYYYIMDRLGNVRYVVDSSGSVVQSYLYTPFGKIHTESGSLSQPYQYVGGEGYYTEEDTGLKLLGQRWYDGEVGRFISRDPIGEEGGLNLYVYVGNRGSNLRDPYGLFCIPISTGSATSFFGSVRIVWIEGLSPRLDIVIISGSIPEPGKAQIFTGTNGIYHWSAKIRRKGHLIKVRVTEWLCWEKYKGWYTKITTNQKTIRISDEQWMRQSIGPLSVPLRMSAEEVCKMYPPSFIKNAEGYE